MQNTRREVLTALAAAGGGLMSAQAQQPVTRFVRFRRGNAVAQGILDGETIREIRGNLFESYKETGAKHPLSGVKLLYPCEPSKVLAVGLNYKSHLGSRPAPTQPEIFYKPITSLQHPDEPILIPPDAQNVHFEGEIVAVIGRKAKNVTAAQAEDVIFGYTCGNDVSERDWQNGPQKDLQWWRAKGADTFAPMGPAIVRGLDVGKSLLQTRVNGKVLQKQFVSDLLFDPPAVVSFVSRYVTLMPGDVIYTGTPGTTSKLSPGDVVEIDIEGIGVLRNKVAAG